MSGRERIDRLRILVAPLDWGLGHATRCIPIIQALLQQNCEVILAAEGPVKALLVAEFPQLSFITLKGYHIHYASSKWKLLITIALQIPKIVHAIRSEHRWLSSIVSEYNIDAVISDNRYGLFHKTIPTVFITHQLTIKSPLGTWSERILQYINYFFINRFSECWVPDMAGENNMAGTLSHPERLPRIPVQYIGPLSRFRKQPSTIDKHLLILLSGPEPQRTLLENIIIRQLANYTQPVLLVRGQPSATSLPKVPEHITVINHLPAGELQTAIAEASLVIARCGYSTVMDILTLGKKSILVPTPGQTEQEYLAKHVMQHRYAYCLPQHQFNITTAIAAAQHFCYRPFAAPGSPSLLPVIEQFLAAVAAT